MSINGGDAPGKVLQLFVGALVAIIVLGIIWGVLGSVSTGSAAVEYPGHTSNVVDSSQEVPDGVSVSATRGYGVNVSGSGADVAAPGDLDNGSWTVCAAAVPPDDQNATYTLLAYNNSSIRLQYDAGDWAGYYDNGTADAYVSVDGGQAGYTPACLRFSDTGDEITLAADGNYSQPTSLTNAASPTNTSWDWPRRIDEVRMFGLALGNNSVDAYMADPVRPLPNTDRLARYMFDEGSGTSSYVYFLDAEASVASSAWEQGVEGPGVPSSAYSLSGGPFSLTVEQGGYLDGAPVVYVSWTGALPFSFDLRGILGVLAAVYILLYAAEHALGGRL